MKRTEEITLEDEGRTKSTEKTLRFGGEEGGWREAAFFLRAKGEELVGAAARLITLSSMAPCLGSSWSGAGSIPQGTI